MVPQSRQGNTDHRRCCTRREVRRPQVRSARVYEAKVHGRINCACSAIFSVISMMLTTNWSLKGEKDMRVVIVVSGYRIGSDPECARFNSFDSLHLLLSGQI